MSRPLRIEYPNAVYHAYSRGNARQSMYLDDADRTMFMNLLARMVMRLDWQLYAYCLMDNHFHILVETPHADLSKGMRCLNSAYAQYFNRRHHRVGHVLQGRYGAKVVERDAYLLELCRYVVLNPVRAGIAATPEGWRWSSFRATAGLEQPHAALVVDWVLSRFSADAATARAAYRDFVAEGTGHAAPAHQGPVVGGRGFAEVCMALVRGSRGDTEIPKEQRFAGRPTLAELFVAAADRKRRDTAIVAAVLRHGYAQADIARHLDVSDARVSQVMAAARRPTAALSLPG